MTQTSITLSSVLKQCLAPSVDRLYSKFHPALGVDRNPKHMVTGREPLWINLGYWAGQEVVSEDNYREVDRLLDSAQRSMARVIADKVQLSSSDVVLDCGFGYGDQDILWAKEYNPKKIEGINITEKHLRFAICDRKNCSSRRE